MMSASRRNGGEGYHHNPFVRDDDDDDDDDDERLGLYENVRVSNDDDDVHHGRRFEMDDYHDDDDDDDYGRSYVKHRSGRRSRRGDEDTTDHLPVVKWMVYGAFALFFATMFLRAYEEDRRRGPQNFADGNETIPPSAERPRDDDRSGREHDALANRTDDDDEGAWSVVPPLTSSPKDDHAAPDATTTTATSTATTTASRSSNPDPFGLTNDWYGGAFVAPPSIDEAFSSSSSTVKPPPSLGYLSQPSVHNRTLVFVSEGDLYLASRLTDEHFESSSPPAVVGAARLTFTIGNAMHPRIHPRRPWLIAFSATYTGHREVYLLDLRARRPATRLTYTVFGVSRVVGWDDENDAVMFISRDAAAGLGDERPYRVSVRRGTTTATDNAPVVVVGAVEPLPLAQVVDAAARDRCLYFVRVRQSSRTMRYIGGTAETLWAWCDPKPRSVRLDRYRGTSKSPRIYQKKWLTFLSDRGDDGETPTATNLFAMPLPTRQRLYGGLEEGGVLHAKEEDSSKPVRLTSLECEDENGPRLVEYDVDDETGDVVLRVGADLRTLSGKDVQRRLRKAYGEKKKHGSGGGGTRRRFLEDEMVTDATESGNETTVEEIHDEKESEHEHDHEHDHDHEPEPASAPESKSRSSVDPESESEAEVDSESSPPTIASTIPPAKEPRTQSPTATVATITSSSSSKYLVTRPLPVSLFSDFHEQQERRIPVSLADDLSSVDAFPTPFRRDHALLVARGALYVVPVEPRLRVRPYGGSGETTPGRAFRRLPVSDREGGSVRVLAVRHLPSRTKDAPPRVLVLATDPTSETAEHALYATDAYETSGDRVPFWGGAAGGGSVRDGGLGSVDPRSLAVDPTGRRAAWTDTDGRVSATTVPPASSSSSATPTPLVLPSENDRGDPIVADGNVRLTWSPGGRYLAIEHVAANTFTMISVADLGDPSNETLALRRLVRATPPRFNCADAYWGRNARSYYRGDEDVATDTLYFLTDRDVVSDVGSPWGWRAPGPHFESRWTVFALPLEPRNRDDVIVTAPYPGGGAAELLPMGEMRLEEEEEAAKKKETTNTTTSDDDDDDEKKILDPEIDFGDENENDYDSFARRAYHVVSIPPGPYTTILCQPKDDPSLVLAEYERGSDDQIVKVFLVSETPADAVSYDDHVDVRTLEFPRPLKTVGLDTSRERLWFRIADVDAVKVVPNHLKDILGVSEDKEFVLRLADASGLAHVVQPHLEYRLMYADAWRLLRDYFYDPDMHGVDWTAVFRRYLPLVARCARREELDDVLGQAASELGALHVFVYGGDYPDPTSGNDRWALAHAPASLGATFRRTEEGHVVTDVLAPDPDFPTIDGGEPSYGPLSDRALRLSGQRGLAKGDVVVAVNGEDLSGPSAPDLGALTRGAAGRSVRLDVVRRGSGDADDDDPTPEPVVVVPLAAKAAKVLRLRAWQHRTRLAVERLARDRGFDCGYVHLPSMSGRASVEYFARAFYPVFDRRALIVDVRHNGGGNVDSWIITALQRRAWSYWRGRATDPTNGGLGWNEQGAFRGHLVVLVDEHTGSDAEAFARGVSELGLGRVVGTRTWGGGIWLRSDNNLVDGGIATAPETGTYNDKWGWGLGIENRGLDPDVPMDNDPRQVDAGHDAQLLKAVEVLENWLEDEPVAFPKDPGPRPNKSEPPNTCS